MMLEFDQGYFLQIYVTRVEQWHEIYEWLHDNVGGGNYQIKQIMGSLDDNVVFLKNEEHVMAYKLRWL